jgi:hypothetical protein
VEWIHLAQNRVKCRNLANTVLNLRFSQKAMAELLLRSKGGVHSGIKWFGIKLVTVQ